MARLIDADALEQEIIKEYYTANNPSGVLTRKGEEIFNAAIDVARCRIADADTVDAVPVVHAKWVWSENLPVTDDDDPDCIGFTGYACSSCGNHDACAVRFYEELSPFTVDAIREGLQENLTPYCPRCGAKMGEPSPQNVGQT